MTRLTAADRRFVIERAHSCCEYCLSQLNFSPSPFVVEHIIPVAKKGTDDLDNLAFSCSGCNGHKYVYTDAHDSLSDSLAPLYNPRQQLWSSHFAWNTDFTEILGTSPTGRATIDRLCLNRQEVVNFRRVLRAMNLHPPGFN
jgi:HNH endonuclease